MLKTRVLAALFFFTGLLLAGSSPSPTGAVIGLAPGNSISFLGVIFFVLGVLIFLTGIDDQ